MKSVFNDLLKHAEDMKTKVETKIFIDEIKVVSDKEHDRDIKLDANLTLRMRYPSLNEFIRNKFKSINVTRRTK